MVVQNFPPGVMAKLGFGYEDFQADQPRSFTARVRVMARVALPNAAGQDMLIQGLTGIAAATGRMDGPSVPVGAGFSDQVGAMNMVYGRVLSVLYWRERSGKGQEVKVDLLSGMLAHQGQEMLMAMNFGQDFKRPNSGIGHPGMDAPFGVYPTSDGWVTIAMSPLQEAGRRAGRRQIARL